MNQIKQSHIKRIKEFIKKVDIFGQSISLSFRQEEEYTTFVGGLASIFVLATIVSFFYSSIIGFFTMSQVSSTTEMVFESDPGIITLDSKKFMFAVQIEHDYFVDAPFFNISVEQRNYKNSNGTMKRMPTTYIDLVICTEAHFNPIFEQYGINFTKQFKDLNLTNFLCPSLEQSHNWTIGGAYTSSDYYFLKFSVTTCVNDTTSNFTWKPQCKTQEEMENYLNTQGSFRFQLYTTNFIVNPDDPNTYIIPYLAIEQFYSFAPRQMFVQSDIFVREKRLNTDKGILMYPLNVEETIAYREHMDSRQQVTTGSFVPNYFAAFYLQRSPFSYDIERKYVTLDELLSYLGGFSQFMIVVLGLFINIYNKQSLLVELANDLYEFNFNQKQENTQAFICNLLSQSQHGREILRQKYEQKEKLSNIKIQSFNAFSSKPPMDQKDNRDQKSLSICSPQQNQKQFIQISTTRLFGTVREKTSQYYQKFKTFMINQKKIGFGYKIILSDWLPFECFQNSETVLFKRAMEQVNKELDIRYIMNQLHEIIKLKKVLFNPDQIELINFSHKPIISLVRERKNRLSSKLQYLGEEEQLNNEVFKQFACLVESYQKLTAISTQVSQDQMIINQRIIGLLGRELPLLIEQEIQQEFFSSIKEAEPEEIEDTPKQ